jgi:lysophospholipase L1-like esterase
MKKLLLLGDSLIEFFNWQERFPAYEVTNAGVAGETVQGLLRRIRHPWSGEVSPHWISIMIGTNNLTMEDYGFVQVYGELVALLRRNYPQAAIILTSILPLQLPWLAETSITRINQKIQNLATTQDKTFYLDLYMEFKKYTGTGTNYLFDSDGVHLSNHGYTLWSEVLQRKLLEWS